MAASVEVARAELHARLLERRAEIESALAARVFAIATPAETADPTYVTGLRAALSVALDYAFFALRVGERRAGAVPTALTAQARMAARSGVGLDTVLRRYVAGYTIFTEFAIAEAEAGGFVGDAALQRILRGYAAVFDRLVAAVSEEHARELQTRRSTQNERRADRVRRLLDGEPIDRNDFEYGLDAHHLALVASGPGAADAIGALAARHEGPLLMVRPERDTAWCWLAGRGGLDSAGVEKLTDCSPPPGTAVAIGEPGQGLEGWRASHRQARAAHAVAERTPGRVARYREVALSATILRDELLSEHLRSAYLQPLEGGANSLAAALEAYFSSGRNLSSAAAALGLDRRTVARRLQLAERAIGRPIDRVAIELQAALRLRRLAVV